MLRILRFFAKLPIPAETRFACERTLINCAYTERIAIARKANDKEKLRALEHDRRVALEMQDEEEEERLTKSLRAKARRLRVPVPPRCGIDDTGSEQWHEGHYTGSWLLTAHGVAALREEIRREENARHQARAQWTVWLSALTGVIGATAGLVAVLIPKCS